MVDSQHLGQREAVFQRCSVKMVFLKIQQNLPEHTYWQISQELKAIRQ